MRVQSGIPRTYGSYQRVTHCLRQFGAGLLILALGANSVTPAVAQLTQPGVDQNTPSGSPVGQKSQQNGSSGNTNNQAAGILQPTDISATGQTGAATTRPQALIIASPAQTNEAPPATAQPVNPSEFEKFVELRVGHKLPRFGANLIIPSERNFALPATATIPPDYIMGVGDQIDIALTGSVEGSVQVTINSEGKVFLPHIGSVTLAGVRYADVKSRIAALIGQQYHGYTVTVEVKQLHGIRVYVTGFANSPGGFSVNSLSTLLTAVLAAAGPSAGGSFRSIKLYRNRHLVTDFDLYDLVRRGDRSRDAVLQNEDVIFIPPVGDQIAVTGSVNEEAIYEIKPGETLASVLALAGGTNALADTTRVELYRMSNLSSFGGLEVPQSALSTTAATNGDILQILSNGTLRQPVERQAVLVRVEGEVNAPGTFYVAPGTSLGEVMRLAGGLSPRAFVYGSSLQRLSVRAQQRESFNTAIQQLELSLASAPLRSSGLTDANAQAAQLASARAVLDRLKQVEPDGRIVFDFAPETTALPTDFAVENNDHIIVPPRPVTVGVFGSVYQPASFVYDAAKPQRISDYIARAGGPQRVADKHEIFVVHASGAVTSSRKGALNAYAIPGDVVFVPTKTSSSSVLAKLVQAGSILLNFGLTAAAFVAVTK
jgi:protein involved in polysaccharide export with SLBB domain